MKQKDDQFNELNDTLNNLGDKVNNITTIIEGNGDKLKDLADRVYKLENNDCHQDSEIDWLKKQVNRLIEKPTFDPTASDFDISQIINLSDDKVGEVNSKFDAKFTQLEENLEQNFVKIPVFEA